MANKWDSKKIFWILLNVVLGTAVILGLAWIKVLWRQGTALQSSRTISGAAQGKTVVSPEIANLYFSIISEGPIPEKLTAENAKKMNAAIEFVKSQGIEDKDIKTANYILSPRYEYDEDRRRTFISGYLLTQTVFLKIRDFTKIDKIIGGLPEKGVNDISSLSFDVENPDKYLNEARKEAFEKARAKGEAMAEQNRVKIKKVISFSEGYDSYPRPSPFLAGKGGDLAVAPLPVIEPGSQEITVTVNVVYEIK